MRYLILCPTCDGLDPVGCPQCEGAATLAIDAAELRDGDTIVNELEDVAA